MENWDSNQKNHHRQHQKKKTIKIPAKHDLWAP